jgi:hypothetical protein
MRLHFRLRQSCGDSGDGGDTLCLQGLNVSPVSFRRLGTVGTRNSASIERPHVPISNLGNGDGGKLNKNGVVPSVPTVPNVQEVRAVGL